MIHIIIEGIDRLGKSTIINELAKDYNNVHIKHFSVPIGKTNEEKTTYQRQSFAREFRFIARLRESWSEESSAIALWDRSHIGEAVYGPIYRDSESDWVFGLEKVFENDETFLFLLEAPLAFVSDKDDGDSLSKNDKNKIEKERDAFRSAFRKSTIKNKHMIQVANLDYFPLNETVERIKKIITNARRK